MPPMSKSSQVTIAHVFVYISQQKQLHFQLLSQIFISVHVIYVSMKTMQSNRFIH